MVQVTKYWKALIGFVTPGAVLITAAVTEGSPGGTTITQAEWITAVCAMVITGGAVAAGPRNKGGV